MAVFYRTNAQSRAIEEQLVRMGIPYKVVGGTKFYDRREIKDLLAYLKATTNRADEVSLKRIVNVPKRGVGDTTVGRLDVWANAHGVTFMESLRHAEEAGVGTASQRHPPVPDADRRARGAHPRWSGRGAAAALERSLPRRAGGRHTVESAGRLENLGELVGSARVPDRRRVPGAVALVADTDQIEDDDSKVTLMTLHSGQGARVPGRVPGGREEACFPTSGPSRARGAGGGAPAGSLEASRAREKLA
jgi:DNA helicase-2/ATP-dependent DNA helicase PcrA